MSSGAPWRVELTRSAQRDLRRLDPPVRARVADSLRALAENPQRSGVLRKLTGAPEWRLRIGDWRALVLLDVHHPNPTGRYEEAKLLLSDPRVPKRPSPIWVTNPGSQRGTVGTPISVQIHASDTAGRALKV